MRRLCLPPAFIFLLACLLQSTGYSSPEYRSRIWTTEDGLPHNSVMTVLQTADGFLWVGTKEGIARFDGVRFTPVPMPNDGRDGQADAISDLCQSKDGTIWAGLENGGLLRWQDERFMRLSEREGLLGGGVRGIVEGEDGSLWIGTAHGLNRFKDEKLTTFVPDDFLTNAIRALEAHTNTLLVGTGSGLALLQDGQTLIYQKRNGLLNSSIRDVMVDREGNTWIATEAGLSRFRDGVFHHFTQSDGLVGSFVTALHEDRAGNLWIGTYDGLNRMWDGRIVAELTEEGTPFEPVNAIAEDAEGNIWVGTRGGLCQLTRSRFSALTRVHGLNHHTPVSVLEDRSGNIWMGMLSGGLNCLSNGQMISYTTANGLSSDLVLGLHEGSDGSIWIGTDHLGGLNQWKDGVFKHFGREHGFHAGITALHEGELGNFWIGTRSGLFRKNHDSDRITRLRKSGLHSAGINAILQDHRGTIWLGTDSGLCRNTVRGLEYVENEELRGRPVLAIYEDRRKKLWIGTRNHGLIRFNGKKPAIYTTAQGLFNNTIYEILEDDFGHLWMSSPKGIFAVARKKIDEFDDGKIPRLPCKAYGKADGIISTECVGIAKPSACKTRDGKLWFATSKGMVIADPSIQMNAVVPPVLIEEVIADNRTAAAQGRKQQFSIPPGRGELEFRYTALSFQIPEKIRFKYKLEGVDRDWIDAGTRRTANYNNVAPGSYRFRVIACNNDGLWNETGDTIELTLHPHLWQTRWFGSVVGIFGIAFVGGGARYISIRKLRRKLRALEQEHAVQKERARIAQDMHDDFGSRLTEALLACDQARQNQDVPEKLEPRLEKVSNVIQEMADTMDTLVWAVNPRNDSLDKLVSYIQEYSHNLLDLASIRCRFEIPGSVPGCPISSEVRHNLFLVLKEALNNAVKYSEASEIFISIQWTDSELRISVQDNGKGFARETVSETGNGLLNMEKRLRNINGRCVIRSSPGNGTHIQLHIPISGAGGLD